MIVNDKLMYKDEVVGAEKMPEVNGGFWARTEVIGGHGIEKNALGISSIKEVVFKEHNMVPLGGVQYAMSKLFNITAPIKVPSLYETNGIGRPDLSIEDYANKTFPAANGDANGYQTQFAIPCTSDETPVKSLIYPPGHGIFLFGIGRVGDGTNNITQYPVSYIDNSIESSIISSNGAKLPGVMIPFRYTKGELTEAEQTAYHGIKTLSNGYTGYYLKSFESEPMIRNYYKTSDDSEYYDEADNTVWSSNTAAHIDTFTEIVLKVSAADTKEFAEINGVTDSNIINTFALYTGIYDPEDLDITNPITGASVTYPKDYRNITLFSKFTIQNEPLQLNKDLDIIYRVYGC